MAEREVWGFKIRTSQSGKRIWPSELIVPPRVVYERRPSERLEPDQVAKAGSLMLDCR